MIAVSRTRFQVAGAGNARGPLCRSRFARTWRLGGFNLMPYRQRNARLARRRCALEWLSAVIAGCAAVLMLAGWQAWQKARLDAGRAGIEHALTRLHAPLAEHATLLRLRDEQRKSATLARSLSEPLTHLRDLLDALSFEPGDGVVLQQLRQRESDTELLATSQGHAASAGWLKRLSAVRGVKGAEVSDLRPAPVRGDATASAKANAGVNAIGPIEFGAHLRWRDLPKKVSAQGDSVPSRSAKNESSGDEK